MNLLIRADNWRFRHDIATSGEYPGKDWYGKLAPNKNETLPVSSGYGAIAYLEVYADDARQLSRGNWTGGDSTVCANCAENCKPDIESEWGYLPLRESSGEIGNYPGVTRCERCNAVIIDSETLAVVVVIDGQADEYTFDSEDIDKAEKEFKDWYEIALESGKPYAIVLLDAEHNLEEYRTGEAWPVEVLQSADTESDAMRNRYLDFAKQLVHGQTIMPGFPHMRYQNPEYPQFLKPLPEWIERTRKEQSEYAPKNPISSLEIPVPNFY